MVNREFIEEIQSYFVVALFLLNIIGIRFIYALAKRRILTIAMGFLSVVGLFFISVIIFFASIFGFDFWTESYVKNFCKEKGLIFSESKDFKDFRSLGFIDTFSPEYDWPQKCYDVIEKDFGDNHIVAAYRLGHLLKNLDKVKAAEETGNYDELVKYYGEAKHIQFCFSENVKGLSPDFHCYFKDINSINNYFKNNEIKKKLKLIPTGIDQNTPTMEIANGSILLTLDFYPDADKAYPYMELLDLICRSLPEEAKSKSAQKAE